MDDITKISELKSASKLEGSEYIVVNQENIDNIIETRIASIQQILKYFKNNIDDFLNLYVPAGTIQAYSGNIEYIDQIEGWLVCDGSQISKIEYNNLYSVIGAKYQPAGSKVESDKFYLPNLKGKLIMGFCNLKQPYTPNTSPGDPPWKELPIDMGKTVGKYSHKLTRSETPSHSHIIQEHTHKFFDYFRYNDTWGKSALDNEVWRRYIPKGKCEEAKQNVDLHLAGKQADLKYYDTTLLGNAGTLDSVGGDKYHSNVQPSIPMNYIIKI